MNTPQNCPGYDKMKNVSSFICKCPNCGQEKEIFSDEFKREHVCKKCKQLIDFSKCKLETPPGVEK